MTLSPISEIRDVHGIDIAQKAAIKSFVQGAVYRWVKNRRDEPFAVRDLVGGENANWSGTPLQVLYEKHINTGEEHRSCRRCCGA